jgi:hypothetical protein
MVTQPFGAADTEGTQRPTTIAVVSSTIRRKYGAKARASWFCSRAFNSGTKRDTVRGRPRSAKVTAVPASQTPMLTTPEPTGPSVRATMTIPRKLPRAKLSPAIVPKIEFRAKRPRDMEFRLPFRLGSA